MSRKRNALVKNLARMACLPDYAAASATLSKAQLRITDLQRANDKLRACLNALLDNSTVYSSAIEINTHNRNGFDAEDWEEQVMELLGRTEEGNNA